MLQDMGLDAASHQARQAVARVRDRVTWRGCAPEGCHGNTFFEGEVEPCINGQVAAVGAYFGQDVRCIVNRLLAEQLPDGSWNCEAAKGSMRSSFNTTICVLEALLEYEGAVRSSQEDADIVGDRAMAAMSRMDTPALNRLRHIFHACEITAFRSSRRRTIRSSKARDLVMTEDNAGRHCFRADELE